MSETPREVFAALLEDLLDHDYRHDGMSSFEEWRAEWLARFDAAGVKVPAHIIEACAKEYMLRRAEGRFGYDADDHRKAFIRGYAACAVTFARGVDGDLPTHPAAAPPRT